MSYLGFRRATNSLLNKRADVNIQNKNGETALHPAAEKEHEALVRLLLEKEARANIQDKHDGETALHRAAEEGHEAMLRLLKEWDTEKL